MNIIKSYIVTNAAASSGSSGTSIQFQDEGVNLGNNTADTVDFVGAGVTATRVLDKVTVTILAGGGSGTVTSVGALSPLFTTANPTTTPTFTAVNQNANLVYAGPATGIAAAPTFRALVVADLPLSGANDWLFENPGGANAFGVGGSDPFQFVGLFSTDFTQLYSGSYGLNITNAGITLDIPSSATGDIFTRDANTFLSRIPDVATGNALISGGVGVIPSYGKIELTTHVSGILPVANGGTGSLTGNFWKLTGTSTLTGDVIIDGLDTYGLVLGGSGGAGLKTLNSIITDDFHVLTGNSAAWISNFSGTVSTKFLDINASLDGVYQTQILMGGDAATGGFVHIQASGASISKEFALSGFDEYGWNFTTSAFRYEFFGSAIAADRSVTFPLLTGNDTFVFEAHTQTLTNKTISGASNTITNVSLTTGVTGILPPENGGTGVANNAASTLTISGNFATTLTVTATTGVTLPTTGTLATLAGVEVMTNKTLSTGTVFSVIPTINDGITFTFNPSSTVAGISTGQLAGNPSSTVNGDLWYNTSTTSLNVGKNGTIHAITTNSAGSIGARVPFWTNTTNTLIDSANLTFVTNRLLGTTLYLTVSAGTATAGTAPLKMTSGTNLTTAEAGAFEYNGTNLFFTRTGTTRQTVLTANVITTEVVVSDTTVTINVAGTDYKLLARA